MFLQVARSIPEDIFPSSKFIERQMYPGRPTKLLTVDDSIQFIMVLPGRTAKEVRQQFGVIIKRHIAGDQSLHAEINMNATSSHPLAQMARESLGVQAPSSPELVGFKRQREELELRTLEHDRVSRLAADYERMCTNTTLDDEAKAAFKKTYLDLLVSKGTTAPAEEQQEQVAIGNPAPRQEIIKNFLSSLVADTTPLVTRIKARDLHKEYMDYHAALKGSADCMLNEVLFGRALKNFPGVRKTRGQTCIIYTLDHAAIRQSLAE